MVNEQFKIVQMGNALPDMLMRDYEDLIGLSVDKVLRFSKPVLAGDTTVLPRYFQTNSALRSLKSLCCQLFALKASTGPHCRG